MVSCIAGLISGGQRTKFSYFTTLSGKKPRPNIGVAATRIQVDNDIEFVLEFLGDVKTSS